MDADGASHPFEQLRFSALWEADGIYFEIFGGPAMLSVYGEGDNPAQWQRAAFDAFVAAQRDLKAPVYDAIFRYYSSIVEEYQEQCGPEFRHLAPTLTSPADLRRVITPKAIHIGDLHPERREVDLLFDCTWDSSHGLAVRIVNGEVGQVGPQDICL